MKYETMTTELPERAFDVVIVGGGLSGVAAAVAAAREGCRVVLIEKYGFLGGMATSALVTPFMRYTEWSSEKPVAAGFFAALSDRLYACGGKESPDARIFNSEILKVVLDEFVRKSRVTVLFHCKLFDVLRQGRQILGVRLATPSGTLTVRGKVFIDATGNADLTAFAGLTYTKGRETDGLCQPMTLCFRLAGCNWDAYDQEEINKIYKAAQQNGEITNPRENVLIFTSPVRNGVHLNTTRVVKYDPVDVDGLSTAEFEGRRQMIEIYNFLRDHTKFAADAQLEQGGAEIGIRESRRIEGAYELTKEDLLATRKFPDAIARGVYDIDVHNPEGTGTTIIHIPENDYYTIPYRSLVHTGADNLLAAGRDICSTHEAHSSVRIMPTTTCMGEAAGIAAAMALRRQIPVREIDTAELRRAIVAYGGLC